MSIRVGLRPMARVVKKVVVAVIPSGPSAFAYFNLLPGTGALYVEDPQGWGGWYFETTAVKKIYAVDDCYAEKTTPDTPHNGTKMICTNYTVNRHRVPYLKFDIGDLAGVTILSARLCLYQDDNLPTAWYRGNVSCYKVSDDTWAEETLTYNTRPALGDLIDTTNCAASNTWYSWDIKDYLQEKVTALADHISLGLNRAYGSNYSRFNSKEFNALDPYLLVEYRGGG